MNETTLYYQIFYYQNNFDSLIREINNLNEAISNCEYLLSKLNPLNQNFEYYYLLSLAYQNKLDQKLEIKAYLQN